MKLTDFHDFNDCRMGFKNFYDFRYSRMEFYEFHNCYDYLVEF